MPELKHPGSQDQSQTRAIAPTSLSLSITGMVFWGMIVTGLVIAVMAMQPWEQEYAAQAESHAAKAIGAIRTILARHPELLAKGGDPAAAPSIRQVLREQHLQGVRVAWPEGSVLIGTASGAPVVSMDVGVRDTGGRAEIVRLQVYSPSSDQETRERRKHVLVFTGIIAMVFGFILKYILQRMLASPFNRMVDTARRVAAGERKVRFRDEGRTEFDFLAGFINKALDAAHRSEIALNSEKERAEVTLRSIRDAVIATDAGGDIQFMNPIAEKLLGHSTEELRGQPFAGFIRFIDELSRAPIPDPVSASLRGGKVIQLNSGNELLLDRQHSEIAISGTAAPMRLDDGRLIGCVIALQDVSDAREMTHRLFHQANRDALTGLYNRQSFENQLTALIEGEDFRGRSHVFLYMDLDQFKVVNDTDGHIAGDELLRELGALLYSGLRADDVLARLGGDEFGVLLKRCDAEHAIAIAEQLRRKVEEFRFAWSGHLFQIGISIGLVPFKSGEAKVTELFSAADMACYAAKDGGRNRVHVYTQTDFELAERHGELRWIAYLNRALEEDLFELFLQPIIALDDGRRSHWEVLLRLKGEHGGEYVSPGTFMSAAERYDLMPKIDRWVILHAFRSLAEARASAGGEEHSFAINLSGASLGDPSLAGFIRGVQAETGVPWHLIGFEITETVAIRNMAAGKAFIEEFRQLGCSFALDDFGSGLSSFGYLKHLPVDFLKIDGGFVRDLDHDAVDRAMVEAIFQVGRIMGIKTVAEWVEKEGIANALREIGIDYVQGRHFGWPAPLAEYLGGASREDMAGHRGG